MATLLRCIREIHDETMADCNGGSAAQEKSRGSPEFVRKGNPTSQLMLAETLDRVSMFATLLILFPRHTYIKGCGIYRSLVAACYKFNM